MPLNGTAIASSGLASPKSVFSQNKQTNNSYLLFSWNCICVSTSYIVIG